MKRILLTLAIILTAAFTFSQTITSHSLAVNDTLTDADTGIYAMTAPVYGQYCYTIQCTSTKVSGSNGLVTAYFQGSHNNSTWTNLDTVIAASNTTATAFDSETTGTFYPYYRVYTLQAGTTVNVQNYTLILYPKYPLKGLKIPGAPTATAMTNTVTKYYTNNGVNTAASAFTYPYTYQYHVVNDSISGDGTSTFTVQGSNDNTNWVTISTNAFTADGTATITNTTGTYYRYQKLNCAHTGTGVDNIKVYGILQPITY